MYIGIESCTVPGSQWYYTTCVYYMFMQPHLKQWPHAALVLSLAQPQWVGSCGSCRLRTAQPFQYTVQATGLAPRPLTEDLGTGLRCYIHVQCTWPMLHCTPRPHPRHCPDTQQPCLEILTVPSQDAIIMVVRNKYWYQFYGRYTCRPPLNLPQTGQTMKERH